MGGSWCLSCVYYPVCNKVAIELLIVGFQSLSEVIYSWGYQVDYLGGETEGMGGGGCQIRESEGVVASFTASR